MVNFSDRLNWDAATNQLFEARKKRELSGGETIDLTESNPTRVGLSYPIAELEEILAGTASATYEPHPLGLLSAREAIAEWLSGSDPVAPEDIVLTASTSEAYSYLFKLLTDPGDCVMSAVPSYPLLDHLSALEAVDLTQFRLLFDGRWRLEMDELEREIDRDATRAVIVVHPNNPTGSFLTSTEQDDLAIFCHRWDLALISDEVFADYRCADNLDIAPPAAERDDVLSFSLGGLSKSAGMPHWKLGWIRVGGPRALRRRALEALELIADSYLSVATPVQKALPGLLPVARKIHTQIQERLRINLAALRDAVAKSRHLELYPVEGGWSAVLRVPSVLPDEDLAVELLDSAGVLVHPGYFFDFPGDGFLVVSLLPPAGDFSQGAKRLTEYLQARVR